MSAKTELFERLKYIESAVSLPSLIDIGLAPSEHNGTANLLRKGLGIVAFNTLEDFVKNKSLECLAEVSKSGVEFSKLTSELQEASTSGALKALVFQSGLVKKASGDWKALVQDEALRIHSTKNKKYDLSKFTFMSSSPNIVADEIRDMLSAYGIKGGWGTMKSVSDSIGGGLPDLIQTFKNLASRRHSAAHVAAFKYDYQWIASVKNEILAIAASLDILLTARCRQINSKPKREIAAHELEKALKYRFLEETGAGPREALKINGRTRKQWGSLNIAISAITPSLAAKNEFLIILNKSKRIVDWHA